MARVVLRRFSPRVSGVITITRRAQNGHRTAAEGRLIFARLSQLAKLILSSVLQACLDEIESHSTARVQEKKKREDLLSCERLAC